MLSHSRLLEILIYDQTSGIIAWRISPRASVRSGTVAGRITTRGYRQITIDRRSYSAHRLAWFYVNGEWPVDELDHINGNKLDNRIDNLRPATRAQNIVTEGVRKNNTSGFKGITWEPQNRLWRARIGNGERRVNLGRFKRIEDAYAAYCVAAKAMHGEFARL